MKPKNKSKIMTPETQTPASPTVDPLAAKKDRIVQIVDVFETGKPQGDYGQVSIYPDGPGNVRQITYGRSQTTEYGNLPTLLSNYANAEGEFSDKIAAKLPLMRTGELVTDKDFLQVLKDAGIDPVMVKCQDDFFDSIYWTPALTWAKVQKFTLPLSMLVIYDSFVHSGHILVQIRRVFPELPPANGGDEKTWIEEYVMARQRFLQNSRLEALQKTVYRTRCFLEQIDHDNWNLDQPVNANGVQVG